MVNPFHYSISVDILKPARIKKINGFKSFNKQAFIRFIPSNFTTQKVTIRPVLRLIGIEPEKYCVDRGINQMN
jgi:hypothetical protein